MSDKSFTKQDQRERDRLAFEILRERDQYRSVAEIDPRLLARLDEEEGDAEARAALGAG